MEALQPVPKRIGLEQVPMNRERMARSILHAAIHELHGANTVFAPSMITESSTIAVCALALDLLTDEDDIAYANSRGGTLFDYLEFEKNSDGTEIMAQAGLTTHTLLMMLPSSKLDSEYIDITSGQVDYADSEVKDVITKLRGPENKRLRLVLSRNDLHDGCSVPVDRAALHHYCNVRRSVIEQMDEVVLRQADVKEIIFKTRTPDYHSSITSK